MIPRSHSLATVALAAILGAGCATTTVTKRLKLPPRSPAMHAKQTIHVMPFQGRRGASTTVYLRQAVRHGGLHDLYDPRRARARDGHLALLASSGRFDEIARSAPEGATTLVWGQNAPDRYERSIKTSSYSKCVRWNKDRKCTKKVKIKRYRASESCRASLRIGATRVADGRVVVDRTLGGLTSASTVKDHQVPPARRGEICGDAHQQALKRAVAFVTPWYAKVDLRFHSVDGDDGLTDRALEHVRRSEFEQAAKLFEAAIGLPLEDEARAWARYNLAVARWALGDFGGCVDQLSKASPALGSDSDLVDLRKGCREFLR